MAPPLVVALYTQATRLGLVLRPYGRLFEGVRMAQNHVNRP